MKLMSVAEVATLKKVSASAVKNACADGTLPAAKVGRAWVVTERAAGMWVPRGVGWRKGRGRISR